MTVEGLYGIFALLAIALYRVLPPYRATAVIVLGGWLLLPVGSYPPNDPSAQFPYWITGLALPAQMMITKAWAVPAAAMLGVLMWDRQAFRRVRFGWFDVPIVLWCTWPLVQGVMLHSVKPSPLQSSAYLFGSWGLTWLLGRLYFDSHERRIELLRGLGLAGLACLPLSVVEGSVGPFIYDWLYEAHPFRLDGAARYIGYRPLGFFEHGSQFGIWVTLCALASVIAAMSTRRGDAWRIWLYFVAAITAAIAIAAQSIGALMLAMVGVAFFNASSKLRPRIIALASAAVIGVGGMVYLSGAIPLKQLAKETRIGQATTAAVEAAGRGSFTWRIARDQELLPLATARLLEGNGQWDWWRAQGNRPWGLTLLIMGQFGAVGLISSIFCLAATSIATAWRSPRFAWRSDASTPLALATIVALAAFDGLLNSFLFFPAILIAGALVNAYRPASS